MIGRVVLACALACSAFAQGSATPARKPLPDEILKRVRPIMDAIYRLDYPRAETLCAQLIRDFPSQPAGYVYRERVYVSEEFSKARLVSAERAVGMDLFSDSPKFSLPVAPEFDARVMRAADEAIEKAHQWLRLHPGDLSGEFLLGSAYAFKSSYEFLRHSRLSAAEDASRTFRILSNLVRRHGDVVDARALTGAFSIVADSLDFKTKVVAALFLGIHGNVDVGRRDMEDACERGYLENDDARLLISISYTHDQKYDLALAKLAQLHERYPENYLVPLEMATLYLISGKAAQALDTYREMLTVNYPRLDRSIVLGRLGVASRIAGDLSQSQRCLREAAGAPAMLWPSLSITRLELGKTLDLQGQRLLAIEQYRHVLANKEFLGVRRDAEQWMARPYDRASMDRDNRGGGFTTLH